ncbi:MAG: bifunctional shikimate kinase/3-dehydroquinate synthase [Actinobacteria bacterium]|nr:bifunctional shikimate kinase/3-dehydroquinate synthase [Actinomycetota bacterium]
MPDGTLNALDRHLALVGFMGAGKSTLGPELAERLGRPFVSVDLVVEERTGVTIAELFAERGQEAFRELEERVAIEILTRRLPAVVELGGGALGAEPTRIALAEHAFTVLLETTPDEAWERVSPEDRPLARDHAAFRTLFEERTPLYEAVADGHARDLDGVVLAASGIHIWEGAVDGLGGLAPSAGAIELIVDAGVEPLHGDRVRRALGERLAAGHVVPAGEEAKSVAEAEKLWSSLRLDRDGTVMAVGGGSTIDLAGFVAAAYLRGVPWVAVPTTLVAQVDAAIGGKTAVDLEQGKNLVGAFHWPARVVVDPELLSTLPPGELENGLAEVVKTGLLAGEPLWELAPFEQVRRCAAFKAAVCLRDPLDRGERAQLNLGHTFAHALEAASGYTLAHGRAVALGLLAALRLSGLEDDARTVEDLLHPKLARVDREAAWTALAYDKKTVDGTPRLVLLERPGRAKVGVELEQSEIRAALDALIA